jgi:hypothetical protein
MAFTALLEGSAPEDRSCDSRVVVEEKPFLFRRLSRSSTLWMSSRGEQCVHSPDKKIKFSQSGNWFAAMLFILALASRHDFEQKKKSEMMIG